MRHNPVSTSNESEPSDKPVIRLPWIPVVGPRLRKAMRKRGVRTVFNSGRNLRDILCNHKSELPENSHAGVYILQCECQSIYIGETKKRVRIRIAEHEKDVFNGRWSNSGAAEHAESCPHQFKWNEASTLSRETDYRRRKIRESLEIRKYKRSCTNVVNRDHGTVLKSAQWDVLMGRLKSPCQ